MPDDQYRQSVYEYIRALSKVGLDYPPHAGKRSAAIFARSTSREVRKVCSAYCLRYAESRAIQRPTLRIHWASHLP